MKTKGFYALAIGIAVLLTSCGSVQKVSKNDMEKRLVGLWEMKAIHNSDEPGYKKRPHGMFKMLFDDGRFINFLSSETGTVIVTDGTYRLQGDSLYIETIGYSQNKSLSGMDNPLNIEMSHNRFMYLKWFLAVDEFDNRVNRWVEEIWQRVEPENAEISRFALQQELRMLLEDKEIIDEITK